MSVRVSADAPETVSGKNAMHAAIIMAAVKRARSRCWEIHASSNVSLAVLIGGAADIRPPNGLM